MRRPTHRRLPAAPAAAPKPQTKWLLHSDARSGEFQLLLSSGQINATVFFTADQAGQLAQQIRMDLKDLPSQAAKIIKAAPA